MAGREHPEAELRALERRASERRALERRALERQAWERQAVERVADRGAAIVDFVLVGGLLTLLFLAVLQLSIALHVRNVLVDCAFEGAQFGALADRDPQAGADRARELIRSELSDRYAEQVSAGLAWVDGLPTVEVRVEAPLPVIGVFGVGRTLTVSGHALAEQPVPQP
ncbi:MAG TPA: TadE/TadG family type IV pilus assembly protein [Kineosporiaceae bacterium]|nr:TadE/TadG family type IV pilus assembly protein [Kineosporiaceae bacterium]